MRTISSGRSQSLSKLILMAKSVRWSRKSIKLRSVGSYARMSTPNGCSMYNMVGDPRNVSNGSFSDPSLVSHLGRKLTLPFVQHALFEKLGDVYCLPVRALLDLLAAAEPVRDDRHFR